VIDYRDLDEMMNERCVAAEHRSIMGGVKTYVTYVKVTCLWAHLYRATGKIREIIYFMPSPRRTAKSTRRFLGKALRLRQVGPPSTINTNQYLDLRKGHPRAQPTSKLRPEVSTSVGQISQQPAGGGSRRAEAADKSGARIHDAADGVRDDQGLRGQTHDLRHAILP